MPILCNYYVTYRCNAYCPFCHFGDHAQFKASTHARTEDVLRNLPELRRLGVRFIDFTGGEPLLHPDIDVFTRRATELGMTASITTNALLYPKWAERLRGSVGLLHFSLDSADREEHDTLRGVPCFDAVLESIEIARALGEHPDLLFTITNTNYEQLPAVHSLARAQNLLLLLNPIFSYFNEQGLTDEAMDYVEKFSSRAGVYLNPSFLALRRRGGNDPSKPLCKAVSRVIVVSPENSILLPCYHFSNESIPIGDSLVAAHRSDRVAWHRERQGRHDFCRGCTVNCYFEPSFAFPVNALSIRSVPSKLRYGYHKYLKQRKLR
ncbi:MAG: radical SAM protein [Ignavibacteriae bacterium]|nr:radical SAM protein [Ignavibacteriota bacterium]